LAAMRKPDLPVPDRPLLPLLAIDVPADRLSTLRLHGSFASCAVPPDVAASRGRLRSCERYHCRMQKASHLCPEMCPGKPRWDRVQKARVLCPGMCPETVCSRRMWARLTSPTRTLPLPLETSIHGSNRVAMQKVVGSSPIIRSSRSPC